MADVRGDALARATALGASHVVNTVTDSLPDAIREVTEGRGADVTYEVTGINKGLELAGQVTRMGGKLCIVGYHRGGDRTIALGQWNYMAFDIKNAHFRDLDTIMTGMRAGMRLVNAGALDPSPLVSHTYSLNQVEEAFRTATERPDGYVKAVIEPTRDAPT